MPRESRNFNPKFGKKRNWEPRGQGPGPREPHPRRARTQHVFRGCQLASLELGPFWISNFQDLMGRESGHLLKYCLRIRPWSFKNSNSDENWKIRKFVYVRTWLVDKEKEPKSQMEMETIMESSHRGRLPKARAWVALPRPERGHRLILILKRCHLKCPLRKS